MKEETIEIRGRSSHKGQPFILEMEKMQSFLKQWPNEPLLIQITVMPKGTNGNQIGYYKKVILPKLAEGWRSLGEYVTTEEADKRIRQMSPFCQHFDEETESNIVVPVEHLTMNKMRGHIDFCIVTAAQEMNVIISNPKL